MGINSAEQHSGYLQGRPQRYAISFTFYVKPSTFPAGPLTRRPFALYEPNLMAESSYELNVYLTFVADYATPTSTHGSWRILGQEAHQTEEVGKGGGKLEKRRGEVGSFLTSLNS